MKNYAPLFVIIAATLWGVDGIVLTPSLYSLPVPFVVFIQSGLISFLLIPLIFKFRKELSELKTKDWISFLGVAVFGGAIGTMSITKALFYVNYVNLSIVILMQKLQPVFALLLATIILKEKLPRKFFLWAVLAIIGTLLMTFGLNIPNFNTGDKTLYAAFFALLASFSFGFSTVLSKRALKNTSFELATYLRFSITAFIMLIIVGSMNQFSAINTVTSTQVIVFFLIAFTTGGTAIFLYYYGLKNITASVAAICELAFPITAVLLEYFIRDNILNPFQWIGVTILVFSIYKVTKIK